MRTNATCLSIVLRAGNRFSIGGSDRLIILTSNVR
jgi:hypothetical protein